VPYDVINDPTAPARLGVSAGKYLDGSVINLVVIFIQIHFNFQDAYVGYGQSSTCNTSPLPGRISTKAPAGGTKFAQTFPLN
jgi:hypothetical protein